MKTCPNCNSQAFDDMDTCFVCLAPLGGAEPVRVGEERQCDHTLRVGSADLDLDQAKSTQGKDAKPLENKLLPPEQDQQNQIQDGDTNQSYMQLEREFTELRQEILGIKELLAALSVQVGASHARRQTALDQESEGEGYSDLAPYSTEMVNRCASGDSQLQASCEKGLGTITQSSNLTTSQQEITHAEFSSGVSCILPDYLLDNLRSSGSYQLCLSIKPRKTANVDQ